MLRRIVGKAIISDNELWSCAGNLQLCAGQASGCEAAVQAISDIFEEQSTDALLLINADNAFNSLNRKALLHNIRYLCLPMAIYTWNCYCVPSHLFVLGGIEILSSEGTTQGDPLACIHHRYNPFIGSYQTGAIDASRVRHVAFADDLGGAGELMHLRNW